eukprot:1156463-Pelagomonas_calceolata.AAC.1
MHFNQALPAPAQSLSHPGSNVMDARLLTLGASRKFPTGRVPGLGGGTGCCCCTPACRLLLTPLPETPPCCCSCCCGGSLDCNLCCHAPPALALPAPPAAYGIALLPEGVGPGEGELAWVAEEAAEDGGEGACGEGVPPPSFSPLLLRGTAEAGWVVARA